MARKGRLRDISLTQLFNLIKLARKTGALSVDSPHGTAALYFREGKIIHASLDGDGNLADLLIESALVEREHVRRLFRGKTDFSDKELGIRLINGNVVSRKDILRTIRKHTTDVVYTTLTWEDGNFRFEPNVRPPANRIAVPINLENLILEGKRRKQEFSDLKDELPSLDVTLQFTESPGTSLSKINLSRDEWKVVSFINPRNTVAQIAKYAGLNEFEVRRIVLKLLRDGLIEIIGRQPAPATATPSPTVSRSTGRSDAGRQQRERKKWQRNQRPDVQRGVIRRLIDRIRGL